MSYMFALGAMPDGASPLLQIIPFVLILAIFYFIILLPTKRKQQKVQDFLGGLKVNDKIVMVNGIYGQITKLSEQIVEVQIADKVRVQVAKQAIGGYQGQAPVNEAVNQ
jgi:preprotein translocase subunit YajC